MSTARLLTTKDLAERWSVTPGHLSNQRSEGTGLPYVKIGTRVRYRLDDVLAAEAALIVAPVDQS